MASLRAGIFCLVFAISVIDLAKSASITKVNNLDLPGGERITKREAPNAPPQIANVHEDVKDAEKDEKKNIKLTRPLGVLHTSEDHQKDDSKSSEEDATHHIYKVKEQTDISRIRRAAPPKAEEVDDMDTAANTVFLPQFRRHFRPANRFKREVNDEAIESFVSDQGEGNGRYVREAQQQADDLDTAANTVFLPQFRKRFRPNFRQF